MKDTHHIILTAQPEAAVIALNEIQKLDRGARPLCSPSAETRLVSLSGGYRALLAALTPPQLIFARHLFPVYYDTPLEKADGDALFTQMDLTDWASRGRPFTVQLRVSPRDKGRFETAAARLREVESRLIACGGIKDDKNPAWAVSLLVSGDRLYAGVSDCADNRSPWNGGEMRFKKDDAFVGRAEFKLLEAFSVFGIRPQVQTQAALPRALDLGAAPGGWSKALLAAGFQVTAVDPAEMAAAVASHPKLTHLRQPAQRYVHTGKSFSLIVNDMRMDLYESCRILLAMRPYLAQGGEAVITLKLKPGHWYRQTDKALSLLKRQYRVANARQLFHNRDEVTAYLLAD